MTRGVYPRQPLAERFWSRVQESEGCWEWVGLREHGYGSIWREGRMARAHRVAFELAGGEIPEGMFVLHNCDNPPCVRPDHLYVGTHEDNMRDRRVRGRTAQGKRGCKGRILERVERS